MKNALIVLKALEQGQEIELKGRTFVWLKEPQEVRYVQGVAYGVEGLAVKGKKYRGGEDSNDPNAGVDTYLGLNMMSLNVFVDMCESIPEDELVLIQANIVLNVNN